MNKIKLHYLNVQRKMVLRLFSEQKDGEEEGYKKNLNKISHDVS